MQPLHLAATAYFASVTMFVMLYGLHISILRQSESIPIESHTYADYVFLDPVVMLTILACIAALGVMFVEATGCFRFEHAPVIKYELSVATHSAFATILFAMVRHAAYSRHHLEPSLFMRDEYTTPVYRIPLLFIAALSILARFHAREEEEECPIKEPLLMPHDV